MNFAFDYPLVLLAAVLAWLPLFGSPFQMADYPWNALLPGDQTSRWIDRTVRGAGVLAILALVLGLAGLYRGEYSVERTGQGANIVLLLDRSRSMDDSFAGRTPAGGEAAKSAVAERLLAGFIADRPHDRVGVAAFSTSPLFVLPLTDNHEAVLAAVRASKLPALAQTHVSKGLAMALSYFQERELSGSKIVLLVSDGAAVIDPHSEVLLRRWFKEKQVRLYWVFLRTAGSPGLFETPPNPDDDNAVARPERYLHLFFNSLGIPYQAYEAENPDAMRRAIADIDRVENQPFAYRERIPRQDLQTGCYWVAAWALTIVLAAKAAEARA